MANFAKLQQGFDQLNRDNQEEVQRFFEANRHAILELDEQASPEEGQLKYALLASYGIALMNKGKFSMAVESLEQAARVEKRGAFEADKVWKESMLRALGTSFYFRREYGKAHRVFQRLRKLVPENETYRLWTGSLLLHRWQGLRTILYGAVIFLLLADFAWVPSLRSWVGIVHFLVTAVLMLGLVVLEIFFYTRRREINNHNM